jgi:hypothetical protein
LTELIGQFNCSEVKYFVEDKIMPMDIYNVSNELFIMNAQNLQHEKIYIGPRIGLSGYKNYLKLYKFTISI